MDEVATTTRVNDRTSSIQNPNPRIIPAPLPPSVLGILDCARYEIQRLEELLSSSSSSTAATAATAATAEDHQDLEDALDDGFMCMDVQVLQTKLEKWHQELFPNVNITPYFAIKCNPDPMVVHWLAQCSNTVTSSSSNSSSSQSPISFPVGFDCASIAELELAQQELSLLQQQQQQQQQSSHHNNNNYNNNNKNDDGNTRIVYANPQRAEADLAKSFELFQNKKNKNQSLWLTVDGVEELYKIDKACSKMDDNHNHNNDRKNNNDHNKIEDEDQDQDQDDQDEDTNMRSRIQLILRILVPDEHSQVPLGEKFGVALENIPELVTTAHHQLNLFNIAGVSFHCGSGCHDPETYQTALSIAQQALDLIHETTAFNMQNENENENQQKQKHTNINVKKRRCWLLDIGGGFPGLDGMGGDEHGRFSGISSKMNDSSTLTINKTTTNIACENNDEPLQTSSGQETTAEIAKVIQPLLQEFENKGYTLIAEPGRYFVEAAACLVSRIYKVDKDDTTNVYQISHGVHGVFKDVLLCNESFVPMALSSSSLSSFQQNDKDKNAPDSDIPILFPSRVRGPSGDAHDVVCASCQLPKLVVGDWLVFDRMGAYTLSIASRSGRPIIRYVQGKGQYH